MRPDPMHYFRLLTPQEQAAAIRPMAAEGMSHSTISAAPRLSVEFVRQIVGDPKRMAG